MKKAFTMIELVFVMVIIAILASLAIPNFKQDRLRQAAEQVVSHIRYTQHLALIDNKFIPSDFSSEFSSATTKQRHAQSWFNGRWQIAFHIDRFAPVDFRHYHYTIFSDIPWHTVVSYDRRANNPVVDESLNSFAVDPISGLLLTGNNWAWSGGTSLSNISDNLNLEDEYGVYIDTSDLRAHCLKSSDATWSIAWNATPRLLFDNLGRPHCYTDSAGTNGYDYMLQNSVNLVFFQTLGGPSITIRVEAQTGYAHII